MCRRGGDFLVLLVQGRLVVLDLDDQCDIGLRDDLGMFFLTMHRVEFADLDELRQRLASVPDMWLAVAGSTLTALLAAFAAFQTSMPDRDPRRALLPIPAALAWLGASGMGCLRDWVVPGTHDASMDGMGVCATFIIAVSLPLSVLLVVMLRRACPIRPGLTALLAGLASASAAATLLNFFHPHDAAATDLLVHVVAMALVILANRWLGGRLLAR